MVDHSKMFVANVSSKKAQSGLERERQIAGGEHVYQVKYIIKIKFCLEK